MGNTEETRENGKEAFKSGRLCALVVQAGLIVLFAIVLGIGFNAIRPTPLPL